MVDNNNLELRLCISIPLHDSLETKTTIEFKAKKRVTISDYSCSSGNWIHCFTLFGNGPK